MDSFEKFEDMDRYQRVEKPRAEQPSQENEIRITSQGRMRNYITYAYAMTLLEVTFNGSFDHVSIDATSVLNLELIEPLHSTLLGTSNKKRSLFQILKSTRTTGGTRLLRANLLQPLKDIQTINARLDCLDELMTNEQLFFGLSQALRKFPKETDRILCHFCIKPKKVTNEVLGIDNGRKSQVLISSIIVLKTALDALPFLSKVLKDANNFLLGNIYKSVCENEKYASIRKRIGEVIDEDVLLARVPFVARTQQCFAVKAGIDGFLDIARRSFCDTSEAIHNLANKYREEFKLLNLKIPFNNRHGFYFNIPQKGHTGKASQQVHSGYEAWEQYTLLNFGSCFIKCKK